MTSVLVNPLSALFPFRCKKKQQKKKPKLSGMSTCWQRRSHLHLSPTASVSCNKGWTRTMIIKAKQSKAKQNKTKQNKTKQNKTKQKKTKQNKTKQNKTKLLLDQARFDEKVRTRFKSVRGSERFIFFCCQVYLRCCP